MSGGHAHYVIVDGEGHRVWSRDRGAATLYFDVLWGPDRTAAFIREQKGGTPDFWMNSVWWQGVTLLDLPRRHLLVHTDQEMDELWMSVLEIRAWLRVVRALWPGWRVTWATRGLHEVMEHLRLPYDTVRYLDDPVPPLRDQWALPLVEDDDPGTVADTLVAVRDRDGDVSLGGLWASTLAEPLLAGPGKLLVPQAEATPFAVAEAVPQSGVHVDARSRRLDWWSLDCPLDPRRLAGVWPGWTLTDHGDAFEEVCSLVGPQLRIDAGTRERALRRVADVLARHAAAPDDRRELRRAVASLGVRC